MGFPYDEAAWSVVDGAMFMGWVRQCLAYTLLLQQQFAHTFYGQGISLNINSLIRKNN